MWTACETQPVNKLLFLDLFFSPPDIIFPFDSLKSDSQETAFSSKPPKSKLQKVHVLESKGYISSRFETDGWQKDLEKKMVDIANMLDMVKAQVIPV